MFFALLFPYLLSQFYRAFLAVVAGDLSRDLGLDAAGLAGLQATFLLAFAFSQVPIGFALDRLGPKRTLAVGLCAAFVGGVLLALATAFGHALLAMVLIGAGCAPVLMAGFYVIARRYSPARFATMSSLLLGLGSLGDPLSGTPLALVVAAFGWRPALLGIAAFAAACLAGVIVGVKDPPPAPLPVGLGPRRRGALDVLAIRELWPIVPLALASYACVIATRGVWITPYLSSVHGFGPAAQGLAATAMGLAIAMGALLYVPLHRLVGNAKYTAVAGVAVTVLVWLSLALFGDRSSSLALTLLVAAACLGAPYAIIMTHARSFMPPHLLGQGVTLLNLAFMGGAGLVQWLSGRYVRAAELAAVPPADMYGRLFTGFACALAAALAVYAFARPERRETAP